VYTSAGGVRIGGVEDKIYNGTTWYTSNREEERIAVLEMMIGGLQW